MIKFHYLNADGGAFAEYIEIAAGTSVQAFLPSGFLTVGWQDYLTRVNRQPAAADQYLQDGNRISRAPTRIEGARA